MPPREATDQRCWNGGHGDSDGGGATGPGILAALHKHAPQEGAQFEAELRDALARAGTDLDVARVDQVKARWDTRVCILANTLTGEEQTLLRRARTGDFSGLRVRDENGGRTTL